MFAINPSVDNAPIVETLFPCDTGHESYALSPFKLLPYGSVIFNTEPVSSIAGFLPPP
ncbi:MAG: hypothetical protein HQK64_05715 [Desulfamplus sp.]|nr:hypothetical protein [Desulfamplus sp.]